MDPSGKAVVAIGSGAGPGIDRARALAEVRLLMFTEDAARPPGPAEV